MAYDIASTEIDGLRMEYLRRAAGPNTIVFLHGYAAGKDVFYEQFEAAALKDYSLLAIDLPGCGGSDRSTAPTADYTLPALALRIKRVLAALEITSPLVAGWSLGGHVGIEMAGRGFDMAGLMIFGTPPLGPGSAQIEDAYVQSAAMAAGLKERPSPADTQTYIQGLYGTLTPLPNGFFTLAASCDSALQPAIGAHWASGDFGCDQVTVVAGWARPLCILHGEGDVFVSGNYISALPYRNLWRGAVVRLPGIGHAPFVEDADAFNAVLTGFAADVFRAD